MDFRSREKPAAVLAWLHERDLLFLYPHLFFQHAVREQLAAVLGGGVTPDAVDVLRGWAQEAMGEQREDPLLVRTFAVEVFAAMSALAPVDVTEAPLAPPEAQVAQEAAVFASLQPLLLWAAGEDVVKLQSAVVHGLQLHCHTLSFPRGLMLRMSIRLYDSDVVEEEAFMAWREDLPTDECPGKQKALIEINRYLTWMEEAAEESSDGSDESEAGEGEGSSAEED